MVAAFPLAKIGLLLMKQLSKPLANYIKNSAKKHPYVRQYVIAPTGRAYNWVEEQAYQVRTKSKPPPLSEDEIIELGSNAIGEFVLFGLLTIVLLLEVGRQGDKKAMTQRIKDDEIANIVNTVLENIDDISILRKKIEQLTREFDEVKEDSEMQDELPPIDFQFLDKGHHRKKFFKRKDEGSILDSSSPSF